MNQGRFSLFIERGREGGKERVDDIFLNDVKIHARGKSIKSSSFPFIMLPNQWSLQVNSLYLTPRFLINTFHPTHARLLATHTSPILHALIQG